MNKIEKNIIQMFLDVNFSWKDTLIEQLNHINTISREYKGTNYFVYLSVDRSCNPILVEQFVPIEIIVEHGITGGFDIYYEEKQLGFQKPFEPTPTGFHLFVENGYITELEVYSLGGDTLEMDTICIGKRYYFIFCN